MVEPDSGRAIERILGMAGPSDLVILPLSRTEFDATHQKFLAMQTLTKKDGRH